MNAAFPPRATNRSKAASIHLELVPGGHLNGSSRGDHATETTAHALAQKEALQFEHHPVVFVLWLREDTPMLAD
jgi:hypothetical protein